MIGLLARYRRFWIAAVFAALCLPMIGQILRPLATSYSEGRALRNPPALPQTWKDWSALPRALDGFLLDRFGFRSAMVRANAVLRYLIASPTTPRVVYGRDGWLFWTGESAIEQSTGRVLRRDRIERLADRVATFHARLLEKKVKFAVLVPPNNSTISRAHLPAWAAGGPEFTEYDLARDALRQRGVPFADARTELQKIGPAHMTYFRKNSHWNLLGALVAFNVTMRTLDLPAWVLDVERVFKGFDPIKGGDLAAMLGVSADVSDVRARIDLSSYGGSDDVRPSGRRQSAYVVDTGRSGPTVFLIGDSFTRDYFRDYLALHAGRLIWKLGSGCDLSAEEVLSAAPQIVILASTERYLGCS